MSSQVVNARDEGERSRWFSQYVLRNISAKQAERHVKNAWIAGIVSFLVTAAFVLLELVDTAIWFDVILIAILAFGVYRRSAVSAVCLFVYFLFSKVIQIYDGEANASNIILGLAFLNYFYLGILGTLKLKALRKLEGSGVTHKRDIMFGLLAGVVATFMIFLAIGYLLPEDNTDVGQQHQDENALSNAEIVERLKPAIVYIETKEGSGSGMIFDDAGYILTNAHVVSGFKKAEVKLASGESFSGQVVGRDEKLDLAVLWVNEKELKSVQFGDSDSVVQGDEVFTFGYPFGLEGDVSFKEGTISRRIDNEGVTYLETSAEIHPGNSGGALVNKYGEVIGVNTAILGHEVEGITLGETIKLAIPINDAKNILEDLKNGRNIVNPKIIPLEEFLRKNPPNPPKAPPPAQVKILPPPPVVTCSGNVSNIQMVTNGTYEFGSGYNKSTVSLHGVVKNNNLCIADKIKIKITVQDGSNSALIQEEINSLTRSDYSSFNFSLDPNATGEYVTTFQPFDAFLDNEYYLGTKISSKLKAGVTIRTQIYDAQFRPNN